MSATPLPVDAGLLARFRSAGAEIAWRVAPASGAGGGKRKGRPARVAHLNDDEARVERSEGRGALRLTVDSGPVGALVVILEADRRGPPSALGALDAGRDPGFSNGAIVAVWGPGDAPADARPRFSDLVELARYALR